MGLFSRNNPGGGTAAAEVIKPSIPAAGPASHGAAVSAEMGLATAARQSLVAPAAPPRGEREIYFEKMKVRIHQQLVERLDVQNLKSLPPDTVRSEVRILIRELCQNEKGLINSTEQDKLMDEVMDETFGLGP